MDNFNDQLRRTAETTGRADLANQCQGRALSEKEHELADALSAVFDELGHDFQAVAAALTERKIIKPLSGGTDWTALSLEQELQKINAELDAAYLEDGYGA